MDLDIGRLRVLAAIDRHGTMTGAAEELAYTPSAISQQVRKLESDVQTAVVERHPRGVSLTEAGRAIVASAHAIELQLIGLRNDLDDLAGARTGTLRLGVFPTFAASVLPRVMSRFRERHPGVDLVLRSSRKAPLRELLEARELDMAMTWDYPWDRVDDDEIVERPLLTDKTMLLLPREHHLARRQRIPLAELADQMWIVRADLHPTRELIVRCARSSGFEPKIAVEVNDYPEAQAMIAAGLGITLCPQLATQPLRDDLVVKQLEAKVPARRICTAYLAGRTPSPAYRAMESTMHEVVTAVERELA